jgi:hypothetical protein
MFDGIELDRFGGFESDGELHPPQQAFIEE